MHITILALGSRGDVQPFATLGRGLQAAGQRVRFITFESFAGLIAEHGLDFHPIHGDAQALVAAAGAQMLALVRSFSALAESYARDLAAPILRETDLIINQLPIGLYGFDLAEKAGVPMLMAAVMPLTPTRAFPFMAFPRLPLPGYNRATYLLGQQMVWQMYRPTINRWRKRTLGLPPRPPAGYFDQLGTPRIPIINGFSPRIVPRPADWGAHIHITGYWFPDDAGWQPPADLEAFIAAGSPPVFVGFGSMPVKDPQRTTEVILEALRQSGQRAVLGAGWGGLGQQRLPDTVCKLDYAPYGWLFPRMAMLIHHGGSGTTAAGLRAGAPACVVPFVFDQHFWGARLAELGVGPRPIPRARLTVARLRDAILQGVSDAPLRGKAAELGRQIRAENGIQNAIQVIHQLRREPHD